MDIYGKPLVRKDDRPFRPCDRCTVETRDECESWDHVSVRPMVVNRLQGALRGRLVESWILELLADEFFGDSPTFDRDRFLATCTTDGSPS